jgi:hypothetical protein
MNDDLAAQILSSVNSVDRKLSSHIDGEEGKIQDIEDRIVKISDDLSEWRFAAERRHSELIKTIESWTDKTTIIIEEMQGAFIDHPDGKGKKDYVGHNNDHLIRKRISDWLTDTGSDALKNAIKIGFLSLLGWIGYILWEALLKGPHK